MPYAVPGVSGRSLPCEQLLTWNRAEQEKGGKWQDSLWTNWSDVDSNFLWHQHNKHDMYDQITCRLLYDSWVQKKTNWV